MIARRLTAITLVFLCACLLQACADNASTSDSSTANDGAASAPSGDVASSERSQDGATTESGDDVGAPDDAVGPEGDGGETAEDVAEEPCVEGELCGDGPSNRMGVVCGGAMRCVEGQCIQVPDSPDTPCNDGDPCTEEDMCDGAGTCVGTTIACDDDEEPCTDLVCVEGECVAAPADVPGECDDEDPCTVDDVCDEGVCAGVAMACDTPPKAICKDASTVLKPQDTGQCEAGECEYAYDEQLCTGVGYGCVDGECAEPFIRAIAPLSTSIATRLMPTFKVDLSPGLSGIKVEVCSDHACSTLLGTYSADADSVAPDAAFDARVVYWRAYGMLDGEELVGPTPVWQVHLPVLDSDVDSSSGSIFDVNLDGYADALVGGCALSDASCSASLYIHHGGSAGLSLEPDQAIGAPEGSMYFGFAVSSAGDVNGDGYPDVIVGGKPDISGLGVIPGDDAAYVYLSGPAGLAPNPVISWHVPAAYFGYAVSGAGDVNGDGYADVVVGAVFANSGFVYHGGPDGPGPNHDISISSSGSAGSGIAVAAAGDVNGDGFGDVIMGNGLASEAFVFVGSTDGLAPSPSTTLTGVANSNFGISVNGAGDVNGDGYSDVLVGDPGVASGYIFLGSADGVSDVAQTELSGGADLGYSLDGADVNGDGYGDVVVAGAGFASLYLGSETGLGEVADMTLGGSDGWNQGNAFVTAFGDCNGDGFADVLIGAADVEEAHLFLGSDAGLADTPDRVLSVPDGAPGYGFSVAGFCWGLQHSYASGMTQSSVL